MLARLRVEPDIEQAVRVAAFSEEAIEHLMDGLLIGLLLLGPRMGNGNVEFAEAVDDFAAVIA